MKKITFLFLISFLLFSCEKPADLTPDPKPSELVVPVDFTTTVANVSVYDGTDGKISILPSSGIPPLQYKLGDGNYQTTEYFDNLKAGTYTVTAKDSKNTTVSKTATITQPAAPVTPPLLFTLASTNVEIYGFQTGSITASVTSGVPPYTYSISGGTTNSTGVFTNLFSGQYNVTVTDSKQQTLTLSTTLTQPDKQLIYSASSVSPNSTLTEYLSTFTGKNRFSIAFRYTTGSYVNSNGSVYNEATLVSISNSNTAGGSNPSSSIGVFEIRLISNNGSANPAIYCKRYVKNPTGTPTLPGDQIWNFGPTVWQGAYIVVTYDGTNLKFYLNGVLSGSNGTGVNINGTVASAINISAPKIFIGTGDSNFPLANNNYNGTITNMKIYNEALTPSDVTGLN